MLQLYNLDHIKIDILDKAKNIKIEKDLKTGDSILSLDVPTSLNIKEEFYIRTKEQEYVVKEINTGDIFNSIKCNLNVEQLEGTAWDRFESKEQTIDKCFTLALAGTEWTVGTCKISKKRTIRKSFCSTWDIIQDARSTYLVEIEFDTINKKINIFDKIGIDKGTYFIDSLNLKKLNIQSDSYNFFTKLKAVGKDGLTFSKINNGKDYIENHQYSKKIKTIIWKDDRYTIPENLLQDAKEKLNELSKPHTAYKADIINLAKLNPKYSILDYKLGDTITLISKNNSVKEKQRIVKITEYLLDHTQDSVEIANTIYTFEDLQQKNQEAVDTISNVTVDNGRIDGKCIEGLGIDKINGADDKINSVVDGKITASEGYFKHLIADKADIGDLHAVTAEIGYLKANKADITELNAYKADIKNLTAQKADITDLRADSAKIKTLEAHAETVDHLLAGNITAKNIQTGTITAESGIIANNAVGDSEISSLSANKIIAGDIDTSLVTIDSKDSAFRITGNQLLINDTTNANNPINRVILGKYNNSNVEDYGLLIRAKDGQTVMLDSNGVHNAGLTSGAVKDNVVAEDANISGKKLDINSVIRTINNNGQEQIDSTKIIVGNKSLDLELSEQKNLTTKNSTELNKQATTIKALDNKIDLKVDTQTYTSDKEKANTELQKNSSDISILKDKISSTITDTNIKSIKEELENKITSNTNKITSNTTKISQFRNSIIQEVGSLNSKNSEIENNLNNTVTKLNNVDNKVASIKTNLDSITAEVDSVQVSNKNIETKLKNTGAGVNLILNSGNCKDTKYWSSDVGGGDTADPIYISPGFNNMYHGININCTKKASGWCQLINNSLPNLDTNKFYTLSGIAWVSLYPDTVEILIQANDNSIVMDTSISVSNYTPFAYTFKPECKGSEKITFCIDQACNLFLPYIKLEEGSTATGWTPSPLDVNQQIETISNKFSKVEQNVDGIKSTVANVQTTTENLNSNFSNLKSTVDSSSSEINQLSNSISLKVDKNDVISSINLDNSGATIDASKVNINGYVTFQALDNKGYATNSDVYNIVDNKGYVTTQELANSGSTTINGGNITTGTIKSIALDSVTVSGCEFKSGNINTDNLSSHGEVWFYQNANVQGSFAVNKDDYGNGGGADIKGDLSVGGKLSTHGDNTFFGGTSTANVQVNGNLGVTGDKSRIVKTKHYGDICMNAIESGYCLFEDSSRCKTNNGKCRIIISNKFLETIEGDYDVILSPYGLSDLRVVNRTPTYFDVVVREGDDCEFYWLIRATQKGYTNKRLQKWNL